MTPELIALALALLLQGIQFFLVSIPANLELPPRVTLAPRDDGPLTAKVSTRTARLARALDNHQAALTLFTPAVLLVHLSGGTSGFTSLLAFAYLAARMLYVPAYAFGWTPWRSVFWGIGFFTTMGLVLDVLI